MIQVFAITEPGAFRASCSISVAPSLRESSDADVKAAVEAIDAIDRAADGISRGAGSCGSLATAERLRGYRREALRDRSLSPSAAASRIDVAGSRRVEVAGDTRIRGVRRAQ